MVSLRALSESLEELPLARASELLRKVERMDREARLAFLIQNAPRRVVPTLLRHRYIALAIAINMPGNFPIGGGGGIALMAGASGLYSTGGYLATIAIAVSPVPLAILLVGEGILSRQ